MGVGCLYEEQEEEKQEIRFGKEVWVPTVYPQKKLDRRKNNQSKHCGQHGEKQKGHLSSLKVNKVFYL